MAEQKNLKVDELDFQGIKTNFKNYLRSQDEFRDYNFEASGLNALLDLLAYNTYYNSFYLNMVAGEAFLSTAQKRNTVVSLAKSLNYTPRSTSAASISGTIDVSVTGSPAFISIPQYTRFTGTIDGTTYNFLTTESLTIFSGVSGYSSEVTLKEGSLITRRYVVNIADAEQRFIIPNLNIDTTTLSVRVLNSTTDTTTRVFTRTNNIVEINENSQVYFLEEVEDGQFQVKFGDNTFGVSLTTGNVVVLDFIVTNGADANDVLNLNYADSISGVTGIAFTATDPASGGSDRESIDSIRFNAPKSFESQNRLVTPEDYRSIMLQQPAVDSVLVWGGEDNDPPTYGTVFIAAKPKEGDFLSPTEKENIIRSAINPKKILTVRTEIVDPEYINLALTLNVKYEADNTTLTPGEIEGTIIQTILNYNTSDLNQFSKYFRYSKFLRLVDLSQRSILSSVVEVRMRKELVVQLGTSARYDFNFANPINPLTLGRFALHPFGAGNQISSNAFTFAGQPNCFLDDNNGIIRVFRTLAGENVGVNPNVGTIDYNTGRIILNNFNPTSFADGTSTLKITAIPRDKDILPLRNQILRILASDINVTLIDDKTISLVNR
jgi:hypothetical protein